jgi:hypothetical protein
LAALTVLFAACTSARHVPPAAMDPKHGKELWLAVSPLSGTGGASANGVLQAHFFADGTYLQVVGLNIAPAPADSSYVAWLVRTAPPDRVKMGTLGSILHDARHQLQFVSQQDLRDHDKVEVMLVPSGKADAMGKLVATGHVKAVVR